MKAWLCLILCFLVASFAQEGVKVPDVEEEVISASPDVSTVSIFPRAPNKQFFAGEAAEILLGFANNGPEPLNITHISASFNYPLDFTYYIQNFTTKECNVTVQPTTQVSLAYFFLPDPLLEPRDFGLVCSVFYRNAHGTNFTSVFFNSTVDLIEPTGGVDTQTFFVVIFSVAFFGLLSFVVYRFLTSWSKSQSYGSSDQGTRQSVDNDWLAGTSADPSLRQRKKKKDAN